MTPHSLAPRTLLPHNEFILLLNRLPQFQELKTLYVVISLFAGDVRAQLHQVFCPGPHKPVVLMSARAAVSSGAHPLPGSLGLLAGRLLEVIGSRSLASNRLPAGGYSQVLETSHRPRYVGYFTGSSQQGSLFRQRWQEKSSVHSPKIDSYIMQHSHERNVPSTFPYSINQKQVTLKRMGFYKGVTHWRSPQRMKNEKLAIFLTGPLRISFFPSLHQKPLLKILQPFGQGT